MPPLLEPLAGEATRKPRSFFTSTLIIQPKPASTLANEPPTSDALAALKSPRNLSSDNRSLGTLITAVHSNPTEKGKQRKTTSTESRIKDKGKGLDKKVAGSLDNKEVAIGNAGPPIWADRAAKAREARIVKLAKQREEKSRAAEAGSPPPASVVDQPRRTRRASMAASISASTSRTAQTPVAPTTGHVRQTTETTNASTDLSSPPPLMLKISKRAINAANNPQDSTETIPLKEYMKSGFYCQDDQATLSHTLVEKVLLRRQAEENTKSRSKSKGAMKVAGLSGAMFPPLPYDYGYQLFFAEEQDFVLPFNIRREAESGRLDGKKKPAAYSKIRANAFPERTRMVSDIRAVCKCDPKSDCGDNCINRIMNYLCGRDCPCAERCTNKSLAKRKGPSVKVTYTGSRGFGLTAVNDIAEGEFVIDYRGEVIPLDVYHERCKNEYAISKNFYALAYDQDEVIDAGARGNEARFINHSCNPNLTVNRYQNLGEGLEEYEVGMWASRDIAAGEELSYDYNFDAFGVAEGSVRVECRCGAPNCVGYLGRKNGEKTAKQIALDIAAEKASRVRVAAIKAKRASSKKQDGNATAGPSRSNTPSFWKTRDSDMGTVPKPKSAPRRILPAGTSKQSDGLVHLASHQLPTPESMDSGAFDIPPPVDFHKSPSAPDRDTVKGKKKARQSMPNLTRPTKALPKSRATTPHASSSAAANPTLEPGPSTTREMSPVPLFVNRVYKQPRKPRTSNTEEPSGPKVLSGWAIWLKRQASDIPRTEEQWQEIKHQRRRGQRWMDELIIEYGRLPSRGVAGQVGEVVTQEMLEAKRKELDEKGIDWTAKGKRGRTIVHSDLAPEPKKRPRKSSVSAKSRSKSKSKSAKTDVESGSEDSDSDSDEAESSRRMRAKQEAIRKRNGAPMGWVYEPVVGPPAQAVDAIPTDLPPKRKRAQTFSYTS